MKMNKTLNIFEGKADNSHDSNKKITKYVSENILKVDSITSSAGSFLSLFSTQAFVARAKLREACERAMMTGSPSFKQQIEEIIWRKVYYDPLSAAKKLRKNNTLTEVEAGYIWGHLNDGLAFYHQLLMSFAYTHKLTNFSADLLPLSCHDDDQNYKSFSETTLRDSFFRILTCLGDLARYMLDIPTQISGNSSYLLSVRYYHQALHYNCEGGLTHSNLATVYLSNDEPLLAAVHYLRAMTCEKPFEAAENNLKRMLDKSRLWLENKKVGCEKRGQEETLNKESKHFLHTCFALVSCFINNKRTEEVAGLCQDVLLQLGKLLDSYDNIEAPDASEASNEAVEVDGRVDINGHNGEIAEKVVKSENCDKTSKSDFGSKFLIDPESMVSLCSLFLLCVKRLKVQGSSHSSMSEVLLISILLTLVSHINTRLEQRFSLVDPTFVQKLLPIFCEQNEKQEEKEIEKPLCNGNEEKKVKKSKLAKLRRRKQTSQEDEESEGGSADECDSVNESDAEGGSLSGSDIENLHLCSSEDDDLSDEDVKIESDQDIWEGLTAEEHVQLIEQEGMLAAVNVTLDWLFMNEEIIKLCSKNAQNLWSSLAKLFNLIKVDFDKLTNDRSHLEENMLKCLKELDPGSKSAQNMDDKTCDSALPENLMLHLVLPSFNTSNINQNLKTSEQNLIRLYRLFMMINKLSEREDTPIFIEKNKYVCNEKVINTDLNKTDSDPLKTDNSNDKSNETSTMNSQKSDDSSSKQRPLIGRVTSNMQTLTAQWLQHEVRNLEERTCSKVKLGGLYLIPDAAVLIHHFSTIKAMLSQPSHMIIIPQIVIDSLDQQKKDSIGARDAIRWLEIKFKHGSRFIRAQRIHERTRLPLIKYPKRKDKEAWEWFYMAECCYFLGAQMSNQTKMKTKTVTWLTGEAPNKLSKLTFSPNTLAEAAGAVLTSVDEFTRKWQISTIGHS